MRSKIRLEGPTRRKNRRVADRAAAGLGEGEPCQLVPQLPIEWPRLTAFPTTVLLDLPVQRAMGDVPIA